MKSIILEKHQCDWVNLYVLNVKFVEVTSIATPSILISEFALKISASL